MEAILSAKRRLREPAIYNDNHLRSLDRLSGRLNSTSEDDIEVDAIPASMALHKYAQRYISNRSEYDDEPFYVVDLGMVKRKYDEWKKYLPRIQPHYAVKCNPDPLIVRVLAGLGVGFDCASQPEIDLALACGGHAEDIIFAHCCKPMSQIRHAQDVGVPFMTFDNHHELQKIKNTYPDSRLLLRVLPDDSRSLCQLGKKFGASYDRVESLLETAKSLELNVIGVSFHVGSGCYDAGAFSDAVVVAHKAWMVGVRMGFDFTMLDVGGGFPGSNDGEVTFQDIATLLGDAIEEYFPDPSIRIIAEPGRFFVHACQTLVVNVIGKRTVNAGDGTENGPDFMYYVNDGVYGSFNCTVFDHYFPEGKALALRKEEQGDNDNDSVENKLHECSVWGPTCDALDCITKSTMLPVLEIGDYIYYDNMGAYTASAASAFNGFGQSPSVYVRRM